MLTPQDIADRFNSAGIDSPAKLDAMLAKSGALVQREGLKSAIDKARADQQAANAAAETQIQALQQKVADVDASLAG